MKKKLLVLDIDGTLTNSKKEITPKTKEKIKEILELGHMVMIASGRPTPGVQRYVDELELKKYGGYTITFNGARVVDCATGEDIYEHRLLENMWKAYIVMPKNMRWALEHIQKIWTREHFRRFMLQIK